MKPTNCFSKIEPVLQKHESEMNELSAKLQSNTTSLLHTRIIVDLLFS